MRSARLLGCLIIFASELICDVSAEAMVPGCKVVYIYWVIIPRVVSSPGGAGQVVSGKGWEDRKTCPNHPPPSSHMPMVCMETVHNRNVL